MGKHNQTYHFGTKLSQKMIGLLNELRWLFIGAFGLFLILALSTHNLNDAAWSVSTSQENSQIQNSAGVLGAWISDILLYFFGNSAWWFVGLLLVLVWQNFWHFWRENDGFGFYAFLSEKFNLKYFENLKNYAFLSVNTSTEIENSRWTSRLYLFGGFILILLASCTLEALQFHSKAANLPFTSGGLLGNEMAKLLLHKFHLSYTLSTLLSLVIIFIAWQLFSGMSWLSLFEKIGGAVDKYLFKDSNNNDNNNDNDNDNSNAENIEIINANIETENDKNNEINEIESNENNKNNKNNESNEKIEPTLNINENEIISTRNNENFLENENN